MHTQSYTDIQGSQEGYYIFAVLHFTVTSRRNFHFPSFSRIGWLQVMARPITSDNYITDRPGHSPLRTGESSRYQQFRHMF